MSGDYGGPQFKTNDVRPKNVEPLVNKDTDILFTETSIIDENGDAIEIDATTRALIAIDYPHHEIHEGSHYFITGFGVVANGGDITVGVTTPDILTRAHVTYLISATSQIEIYIYEDSAFTLGTPIPARNNDREHGNGSDLLLVTAPVITDLGLQISAQSSGKAGTNPSKGTGGAAERENEIILKRNTKYLFQTISRDNDNIVSFRADWYEHASKA